MSPRKSASKGKKKARRRSLSSAPEKRAMAPTGVKFQGCGATRRAAASTIKASASKVRYSRFSLGVSLNIFGFLLVGCFGNSFGKSRFFDCGPQRRRPSAGNDSWVCGGGGMLGGE